MAACAKCGVENAPHANFCSACGAPLAAAPPAPPTARKTVTVLFSDVVDSTRLGEQLDPESLRRVMSRWFEEMRAVLERHGGTVEKFIGDAVMAVFGVPQLHEDDALRAASAAAEMRVALGRLNEQLARDWAVELHARTGINTGEVVAGDAAAGQAMVTGDAVNTAKRLEQAARAGEIVVGGETRRLIANAALLEPRAPLEAKGKAAPLEAWTLLAVLQGVEGYARRLDAPLVGRAEELAALRAAWRGAVDGRECRLLTVLGPAGIGKSRLASELCAEVRGDARVLRGRCLPYGDGITFWPLVQIVGSLGGDDAVASLLRDAEDGALALERIRGAIGPAASGGGGETLWAVRRLFEELARDRPLVVLLEDIHWAQPTFLDLVEYAAGWIADAPVLLLCLARPELLDERPSWLSTERSTALVLGPLTDAESEALLDELAQEWPLDASARATIAGAAEGNPLYLEQMAAMVAEGAPPDAIPPTIQALLSARLDRLPAAERTVLERASVAGKEFGRGAVLELVDESERPDVDAHLLSLARRDLLAPGRASAREGYRFRHALIRDAAYARVPKEERAHLHERFANWASATAAGRAGELDEIVGWHLEQAFRYREQLGPLDEAAREVARRAGELLGRAGRRAFARDDMPAALNLLDRAVALVTDQDPARLELMRELSSALWSVGETARAETLLQGVAEAASAAGDDRQSWYAALERSMRATISHGGAPAELLETAERARDVFERLGDELGLARAWRRIAIAHRMQCRYAAAADAGERALQLARKAEDTREESRIVDTVCTALLFGPARVDEAVTRSQKMLADAGATPLLAANVASALAGLEAMRGDFEQARTHVLAAERAYERLGIRLALAGLAEIAGMVELYARDLDAAEEQLRRGYELVAGTGAGGFAAVRLAEVLLHKRSFAEAERLVEIAAEVVGDDVVGRALCNSVRARLLAANGRAADAVTVADSARQLVAETDAVTLQADTLLALRDALDAAGRTAEARVAGENALRLYARKGNVVAAANAARPAERIA